jgi:hypothetical protein
MVKHFRGHYLHGEGIVCSQAEWLQALYLHKSPLQEEVLEQLVQVLVTLLLFEGDSKRPRDDPSLFAAALRWVCGSPPSGFPRTPACVREIQRRRCGLAWQGAPRQGPLSADASGI